MVRYFAGAARDRGVDVCRALREEIGAPTVVSTDGASAISWLSKARTSCAEAPLCDKEWFTHEHPHT